MADKIWSQSVTALAQGAGDQAIIDYGPTGQGARNQALYAGGSILAGLAAHFWGKRYPVVQHVGDGLLVGGSLLAGQSGMHYLDNDVLAKRAANNAGTSTGSGTGSGTQSSSGAAASAPSQVTANASAAITASSDLSDAYNG